MIKIGCISWSHRNDFSKGAMDIFTWMEHCKQECRLDGAEIWNNHFESLEEDYLQKIKKKSKELGLPVYSVATKCILGSFSDEEVKRAKDTMREWLKITDYLGASIMRISIGGEGLRDEKRQEKVFLSLSEVIQEGKYPHITVGIENQEPGVVQNVSDVKKMKEVSGGLLKVVLDNGSFIKKGDSYGFMEEVLLDAAVVHVKFFDINEDGSDKILDYAKIKDILKRKGYDGYVSIEYDSNEPAVRDVPKIASYLRKVLLEVE
ncbi:MAG: sugar phosphate isomerase/epimerase [Faecalicatena sp.]|uniref:sugar phosphate isomerase/epimerase family protein n=1 Tax=Faecalicatena sp. TaxID=2005360 RepID=UPI00258D53A0|nr:TIM barrel protein [Faecalicatena sp.]MCI6465309.1 sugar phosphate isomerase/epimerase [Faecalicatena sp.]MDY5617529.1 TIM barrel protein [Lachnospiraceae bacterium]